MKKAWKIGASAGFLLGVILSLGMDVMFGNKLGNGWSDAVAKDLNRFTGTLYPSDHPAVFVGVVLVIGFIGTIGAVIGGFSLVLIERFFATFAPREP